MTDSALSFPRSGPTRLLLDTSGDLLPVVRRVGTADVSAAGLAGHRGAPLLIEQSRGTFARPGLRGHRNDGTAWSPQFRTGGLEVTDELLRIDAADAEQGLALRTEVEALVGGSIRIRHTVTNTAAGDYVLDGLEVTVPVPDSHTEILDLTGRHERERTPQRHTITDGLWLREVRHGRSSLESPTVLIAGTPGFGFAHGSVIGVHVAFSGNSVLRAERGPFLSTTVGGGELLLPGEIVLGSGESYTSPWVVVTAGTGLDDLAAAAHEWQRTLAAHPAEQPVVLNVWEAVYFDHDLEKLIGLAERAARVGVERYVLDDGWFRGRRDDTAGLGDWWVDAEVWPNGLGVLIDRVRELGMQFGLWFEPEMVNPDSDLYREHPDWILRSGERVPVLHRDQLVLDLTREEVWTYVRDRVSDVLGAHDIEFVKWDHNRDLLEAGTDGGRAAAHEQTLAYYRLLDDLRERHPRVAWESCASGGGRIDLGVVEHVQRFWTSDMTDALSRQHIQRWTAQLVAPEYLGAHISAPTSHQTGRTLPLDFRAATALFGAFGIEWDLTSADDADLDQVAAWIARHKAFRPLLHSGRTVRLDVDDDSLIAHGVISRDRRRALLAVVQLDEAAHNRGTELRLPGLLADTSYAVRWEGPVDPRAASHTHGIDPTGPTGGREVTGAALAEVGLWLPRRRPETILLVSIDAV